MNDEVAVGTTGAQHRFTAWDQVESESLDAQRYEVCSPDDVDRNVWCLLLGMGEGADIRDARRTSGEPAWLGDKYRSAPAPWHIILDSMGSLLKRTP
jgi:hypothetical protein